MLELLDGAADPFARDLFDPGHFTASVFVLNPDRTSVLLILHSKFGFWLQPGGHIEPDDKDLLCAGLRELAEETGLTRVHLCPTWAGLLDVDVHDIPANPNKGEPDHQHFDVRFLLETDAHELEAGSDADEAAWVPVQRVPILATDESVRRAMRKLTAGLGM
jgi:8-oxo-dGTP pyrophosphatase MutT (NUDIX family)